MSVSPPNSRNRRRWWRLARWASLACALLLVILFVVNGLFLARGERPPSGTSDLSFARVQEVGGRLETIGAVMRAEGPVKPRQP